MELYDFKLKCHEIILLIHDQDAEFFEQTYNNKFENIS